MTVIASNGSFTLINMETENKTDTNPADLKKDIVNAVLKVFDYDCDLCGIAIAMNAYRAHLLRCWLRRGCRNRTVPILKIHSHRAKAKLFLDVSEGCFFALIFFSFVRFKIGHKMRNLNTFQSLNAKCQRSIIRNRNRSMGAFPYTIHFVKNFSCVMKMFRTKRYITFTVIVTCVVSHIVWK